MFRVPASAPADRDLAAAVPETRPLATEAAPFEDAEPFEEVERGGEAEAAVLFAGPGESVDSEPPPRRGRRGRLLTWAPPLPHSPCPLGPPRSFQSMYPDGYCSNGARMRPASR